MERKNSFVNGERDFLIQLIKYLEGKGAFNLKEYYSLLKKNNIEIIKPIIKFKENDIIHYFFDEIQPQRLATTAEDFLTDKESTGSYYTPQYIVRNMINSSLNYYLTNNLDMEGEKISSFVFKEDISQLNIVDIVMLKEALEKLKIIDIACGAGIFLIEAYFKLFRLNSLIYFNLNAKKDYDIKINILNNNLYGIDIQSLPLQVFILSILLDLHRYEEYDFNDMNFNIFQANSVLGDEIYSIDSIRGILVKDKFNIVVGNPPYIGEKGNRGLFEEMKKCDFGYSHYEGKMDYFYYFIYRGLEILAARGILTYITTNYFVTADGGKKLRAYLKENASFLKIINFNDCCIFDKAKGQHNMIFTLLKEKEKEIPIEIVYFNERLKTEDIKKVLSGEIKSDGRYSNYVLENQSNLYGKNGNIIILPNKTYSKVINKILSSSDVYLDDICYVNQGIVSGADKVTKRMTTSLDPGIKIGQGIFVLDREELKELGLENCKLIKPFFKNSDIKKYYAERNPEMFILYLDDNNINDERLCKAINNHLIKFYTVLSNRREVRLGVRPWYALQWYRDEGIFKSEKILVPQRSRLNTFGYSLDEWYASADVYFITKKGHNHDIKFILGLLNSKIIYFWLYNMGKRKGKDLELYSTPLKEIPIIKVPLSVKEEIVKLVDGILNTCDRGYDKRVVDDFQNKIDDILYSLYGFNKGEIEVIEELYNSTGR